MGSVLDVLIGNSDRLDKNEYKDLNHSKTEVNSNATLSLSVGEISTKSDMLKVEERVLSGQIVIVDVSDLGTGIDKDDVVNFLSDSVEEVDGDISWRSSMRDELILTPDTVQINRDKI